MTPRTGEAELLISVRPHLLSRPSIRNQRGALSEKYPGGVAGEHVTGKRASRCTWTPGTSPDNRLPTRLVPSTLFRSRGGGEASAPLSHRRVSSRAACVHTCVSAWVRACPSIYLPVCLSACLPVFAKTASWTFISAMRREVEWKRHKRAWIRRCHGNACTDRWICTITRAWSWSDYYSCSNTPDFNAPWLLGRWETGGFLPFARIINSYGGT